MVTQYAVLQKEAKRMLNCRHFKKLRNSIANLYKKISNIQVTVIFEVNKKIVETLHPNNEFSRTVVSNQNPKCRYDVQMRNRHIPVMPWQKNLWTFYIDSLRRRLVMMFNKIRIRASSQALQRLFSDGLIHEKRFSRFFEKKINFFDTLN